MNKTKPRKSTYKINIDCFQFELFVYFGKYDTFHKIAKQKIDIKDSVCGDVYGLCYVSKDHRRILICINDKKEYKSDIKLTIMHEISHAIDWIIDCLSLGTTREHTETRANLIEYVYSEFLRLKLL